MDKTMNNNKEEVNLLEFVRKMNRVNSKKFDIQNMLRLSIKVDYLLEKYFDIMKELEKHQIHDK